MDFKEPRDIRNDMVRYIDALARVAQAALELFEDPTVESDTPELRRLRRSLNPWLGNES